VTTAVEKSAEAVVAQIFANYRQRAEFAPSRCESGSGAFAGDGDTLLLCERFSAPKTTWRCAE